MRDLAADRRCRHGFATLVAVVMIAILGTTLLAMTTLFHADAQRSMRNRSESQLRQLLIAGGAAAAQEVAADTRASGARDVPVPDAIENASVVIEYTPDGATMMRATVSARIDTHRAVQTMTFERTESGWALSNTRLRQEY